MNPRDVSVLSSGCLETKTSHCKKKRGKIKDASFELQNSLKTMSCQKVQKCYRKRRPASGLRRLCLIQENLAAHKCALV